mgnify:CR=1 FL=1
MGAKQSQIKKDSLAASFYIKGVSKSPHPGLKIKNANNTTYCLIKLLSETDNSFNFLAVKDDSIIASNIQQTHLKHKNISTRQYSADNLVVVKFIKLYQDKVQMIHNEIEIMNKFCELQNNNNIIQCFDIFEYNSDKKSRYECIVTPYANGGTLLDHLSYFHEENESKEEIIKQIVYQLLKGLSFLHSKQVVHRDVKLNNIFLLDEMISDKLQIVLADFGCATYLTNQAIEQIDETCDNTCDHCKDKLRQKTTIDRNDYELTEIVGTPIFIAPEMYEGIPYGPEVDIWSLGIVMYALMSGMAPFPSSTNFEVLRWAVLNKVIEYPDSHFAQFSEDAKSLLKMMLIRDPSQRIDAQSALNHKWFSNLNTV